MSYQYKDHLPFKKKKNYPHLCFNVALMVKNLPASAVARRDMGLIAGLGRFPRGRRSNPFHYSCLENPTDRGAWRLQVHGVAQSRTLLQQLSTHALLQCKGHWSRGLSLLSGNYSSHHAAD